MIEASTQFMVGRLSTESGKCNSFNLDGDSEPGAGIRSLSENGSLNSYLQVSETGYNV